MPLNIDFEAHNAEVQQVWEAFHAGNPIRVPMILGTFLRFTVLNPEANLKGITFGDYFHDPDVIFEHQLRHEYWVRHNVPSDTPMGIPDIWTINVDLMNSYEQLWYGAELRFIDGNIPDTPPFLSDETKYSFIEKGPPEPFSGWMGRIFDYYEHCRQRAEGYEFHGRPVQVGAVSGAGADGAFTNACALRGPTELCLDMYTDPEFYHALMDLITTATINRIYAFRERMGQPRDSTVWGYTDDSIQLVSVDTYREFIMPYHKRLFDEFGAEGPNAIHLCGDATHLFKTLRDEFNVMSFDTGFPVDHGWLRDELGPDVTINGGPHADLLLRASPQQVRDETKRILQSGIMRGGKFVLREGNNLAPGTPLPNIQAMYDACRQFGRYDGQPEEM